MKLQRLVLFLIICQVSNAWSNIYICSSPSAKPVTTNESIKSELILSTSLPYIESNKTNVKNLENKSPFLIYYAVDSKEEFMQNSVRFEVAKLLNNCRQNSNVQFVAFLNSLYVDQNSFILCKNKKVSFLNFNKFSEIDKKLKVKRKYFSRKGQKEYEYGPLDYLVDLQTADSPYFYYPLAHPDFLYDLVSFTILNQDLFPSDKYAAFLNLKSHGSESTVLSGLHSCQEKAKNLTSKKIIKKILTRSEIEILKKLNSPIKVEREMEIFEKIVSKLDLGSVHGIGSFNEDEEKLGNDRLSIFSDGLGNGLSQLHSTGLGASLSFGTDQANLGWVLRDIFINGSDKSLGFLMLESCETNRNPYVYHKYISNVFGYYTAKKSLWYRNLNWWELLERAEGSSEKLVEILKVATAKIPNIEVVEK